MTRWISVSIVILLFLPAQAIGVHAESTNTLSGGQFVITYPDGYHSDAKEVLSMLQSDRRNLSSSLPDAVETSREIRVRIYSPSQWSGGGVYWKSTNPPRINLLAPSENDRRSTIWYKRILAHEYMNIVLWSYASRHTDYRYWSRNPSWFPEGLSEYYAFHHASPDIEQKMLPDRALESMKDQIRQGDGYFDLVAAGDEESGGHLIAHYMIETYGEDAVLSILADPSGSFPTAVERQLEVPYTTFKSNWLRWANAEMDANYDVEALSDEMVKSQQNVTTLKKSLRRQNKTIQTLHSEIEEQNETIRSLRSTLGQRNTTIKRLRSRVETQENIIRKLRREQNSSQTPNSSKSAASKTTNYPQTSDSTTAAADFPPSVLVIGLFLGMTSVAIRSRRRD